MYSRVLLAPPPLTLAAGAAAVEDADDEDEDDELAPAATPLEVPAASITTPEAAPLPGPEAEGVLHADPLPGLPAEDRT